MSSTSSTSSSAIRLTGMATGLDTDNTVKQMMKAYQTRLDKMKQDKQSVTWRQELYRDILTDINTFKSTYYDVLKPDSYMLSKNSYSGYKIEGKSSVDGLTAGVSLTASTGSQTGSYNVQVNQLAESAQLRGTAMASTVTLDTKLSDLDIAENSSFTINYKDTAGNNQSKLIALSNVNTMTISDLSNKVASDTSNNVNFKFSELTGSFTLETIAKGSTSTITATNTTNDPLTRLNITSGSSDTGLDAIAQITNPNGVTQTVTKSSNIFTIDNVTYSLVRAKTGATDTNTVTVSSDTQKPFDKIKAFIEKYNEIIDKVNTKISEKKQYTYLPLTDEEKEAMSEDQIESWETKAKQGLLRSDGMLQNMLTSLRSAFYEGVQGAGITLSEIGLSTSKDTTKRGKIIIDEEKLKSALETRGDQVAAIFTKPSATHPTFSTDLTSAQRKVRSEEEGIFQKVQDILQDYTRTTRDSNGKKGLLLERVGLKGDLSEYTNLLTKDLEDRQKRIDGFLDKMADQENRYYSQFAKLESAMNQLNSQSSWLSQQLGTSG